MALAFDLRGEKARNGLYKTKALQLYEACIGLFSKTSSRVDLTSVIAAAGNNKARLFFEQSNYEDCKRELHRLQTFMTIADRNPNKGDFMVDDDVQGILLNMLLLWPPIVAQAA